MDNHAEVRGVILDHRPPFFFSISTTLLSDNLVLHVSDLIALVEDVHDDSCKRCDSSQKAKKLLKTLWVPIAIVDLAITYSGSLDWQMLSAFPSDADLRQGPEPRIRIFAPDKAHLRIHFVTMYEAFTPPAEKVLPNVRIVESKAARPFAIVETVQGHSASPEQAQSSSWVSRIILVAVGYSR